MELASQEGKEVDDRISGLTAHSLPWGRKGFAGLLFLALVAALLVSMPSRAEAACTGNAIVCENQLPGTPAERVGH